MTPKLVGLSGYAQSGKDTAARVLIEHFGFQRVAFADALRDVLYALNPLIPVDDSMSAPVIRLQNRVDKYGWDVAKTAYPEVRALLQRLGTEAGREILGTNIWVDTAMRHVDGLAPGVVKYGGRYVFTDVRFPNEYAAIKDRGGEVWRIEREGHTAVNAHPSETALDGYGFDRVIFNNAGLLEFDRKIHVCAAGLFRPARTMEGA